jgi:hypothetical protein
MKKTTMAIGRQFFGVVDFNGRAVERRRGRLRTKKQPTG